MEILQIEQDSPEWLAERRKSVGGSDAKGFLPSIRKNSDGDYRTAGFWQYIGEQLTNPRDINERAMDRGHRLEEEAVKELETIVGRKFQLKPGLWRDGCIHISSDGAEPGDNPTYDCEIKCLNEGKHFKYLYKARYFEGAPIDLVPNEAGTYYKEQVLHAFVVNKGLKTRYFALYEPNARFDEHKMVVIAIHRDDIAETLKDYEGKIRSTVAEANLIVNELIGDSF